MKPHCHGSRGTTVFKGSFQGLPSAIKRVPKEAAAQEIDILQYVKFVDYHPNIVYCRFVGTLGNYTYIALELCSASLADAVCPKHALAPRLQKEKVKALRDIILGIEFLHDSGVIHGDIEPRNILVRATKHDGLRMLISDFSSSIRLGDNEESFQPNVCLTGTPGWTAPEVLAANAAAAHEGTKMPQRLGKSVDIWGFGRLVYFVMTDGKHMVDDTEAWDGLDREAVDIMKHMLAPEASQRPNAATCLLHPFFWHASRRLDFLEISSDLFDRMRRCCSSDPTWSEHPLKTFDATGINNDWTSELDLSVVQMIPSHKNYSSRSVIDLLRVIYYLRRRYFILPATVQNTLGPLPQGFLPYFSKCFPDLLMNTYSLALSGILVEETAFLHFLNKPCH